MESFDQITETGTITPTPPLTNAERQRLFVRSLVRNDAIIFNDGENEGDGDGDAGAKKRKTEGVMGGEKNKTKKSKKNKTQTQVHPIIRIHNAIQSSYIYSSNAVKLTSLVHGVNKGGVSAALSSSASSSDDKAGKADVKGKGKKLGKDKRKVVEAIPDALFRMSNIVAGNDDEDIDNPSIPSSSSSSSSTTTTKSQPTSNKITQTLKSNALSHQASTVLNTRCGTAFKVFQSLKSASLTLGAYSETLRFSGVFDDKSAGWRVVSLVHELSSSSSSSSSGSGSGNGSSANSNSNSKGKQSIKPSTKIAIDVSLYPVLEDVKVDMSNRNKDKTVFDLKGRKIMVYEGGGRFVDAITADADECDRDRNGDGNGNAGEEEEEEEGYYDVSFKFINRTNNDVIASCNRSDIDNQTQTTTRTQANPNPNPSEQSKRLNKSQSSNYSLNFFNTLRDGILVNGNNKSKSWTSYNHINDEAFSPSFNVNVGGGKDKDIDELVIEYVNDCEFKVSVTERYSLVVCLFKKTSSSSSAAAMTTSSSSSSSSTSSTSSASTSTTSAANKSKSKSPLQWLTRALLFHAITIYHSTSLTTTHSILRNRILNNGNPSIPSYNETLPRGGNVIGDVVSVGRRVLFENEMKSAIKRIQNSYSYSYALSSSSPSSASSASSPSPTKGAKSAKDSANVNANVNVNIEAQWIQVPMLSKKSWCILTVGGAKCCDVFVEAGKCVVLIVDGDYDHDDDDANAGSGEEGGYRKVTFRNAKEFEMFVTIESQKKKKRM